MKDEALPRSRPSGPGSRSGRPIAGLSDSSRPSVGPADPPGTSVVEMRQVTRRFGAVTALDRLSFQVNPGELVGVVGPDGAGKTTLMRLLAGVLPASAGDVVVLGHRLSRDPEAAKARLAYMPQRFGLYEDLTVAENLAFYADLHRVPQAHRSERSERLYQFSGLGAFRDRLAGHLSGGMKQKLALSCCLIHRPALLLLDEPTFGVDPISRRELWMILHEMVAGGMTAVMSTSYLDEAERCDRVLLLDHGRPMAMDSPTRLLSLVPADESRDDDVDLEDVFVHLLTRRADPVGASGGPSTEGSHA